MSTITCPGCGGVFPLEAVAGFASFQCSQCGTNVAVPTAQPAAPPATPAQRPTQRPAQKRGSPKRAARQSAQRRTRAAPEHEEPLPAAEPARRGRQRRGDGDADDLAPKDRSPPIGLFIGIGVVVLAVVAFALTRGDDIPEPVRIGADGEPITAPAVADNGGQPAADPNTDPIAWRALPAQSRKDRITLLLARADTETESVVRQTADFLRERGEIAAIEDLARRFLKREPTNPWAAQIAGRQEVTALIDQTLRKCEMADEVGIASVMRLRELKRSKADEKGKWWAEGADLEEVTKLLAEVEAEEKALENDGEYGRARWRVYQASTEPINQYPFLDAAVGPYLIFVQVAAEKGTALEDCDPEARANAEKVLAKSVKLFETFYEGWMTEFAPHFGFERYDEKNVDHSTILKAIIFASEKDYATYNASIGSRLASSARAYYSKREPRFICSYEGGDEEDEAYTNHVQAHEATHQLVHFFTWDTTRKAIGREPRWLDALHRPLWSTEGFAEFFSAYTVEGDTYSWMQPLDNRMQHLWIFGGILEKKEWKRWPLDQILRIRHGGELQVQGAARAKPAEQGMAANVMANLFYAEAWSFVHFLWYADAGGAPKYRDRLIEYFKLEFELDYGQRGKEGAPTRRGARVMTDKHFKRVFGLMDSPAKMQALYEEWKAFEKALLAKHKSPKWDEEKKKIYKNLGLKE